MRCVPLSNHPGYALVDDADYPSVAGFRWHLDNNGYVVAKQPQSPHTIRMHRLILSAAYGQQVDHVKPTARYDNRRCNIRLCTPGQNTAYGRKARTRLGVATRSRFKHVTWAQGRWSAYVAVDGKHIHLGRYDDEREAARAADAAAFAKWGAFAWLNLPNERYSWADGMSFSDVVRVLRAMTRKTTCKRGHALTPDNTYWLRGGGRNCRRCAIDRAAAHKRARRGVA